MLRKNTKGDIFQTDDQGKNSENTIIDWRSIAFSTRAIPVPLVGASEPPHNSTWTSRCDIGSTSSNSNTTTRACPVLPQMHESIKQNEDFCMRWTHTQFLPHSETCCRRWCGALRWTSWRREVLHLWRRVGDSENCGWKNSAIHCSLSSSFVCGKDFTGLILEFDHLGGLRIY